MTWTRFYIESYDWELHQREWLVKRKLTQECKFIRSKGMEFDWRTTIDSNYHCHIPMKRNKTRPQRESHTQNMTHINGTHTPFDLNIKNPTKKLQLENSSWVINPEQSCPKIPKIFKQAYKFKRRREHAQKKTRTKRTYKHLLGSKLAKGSVTKGDKNRH